MAPKKKTSVQKKDTKVVTPKSQPKPVAKNLKRRAAEEEEEEESDKEDFGKVDIDMGSSEEEDNNTDNEDDITEAFPEITLSDDDEDDVDFEADSEEGDEEEEEDEDEDEDEDMEAGDADEAELDEELELELERENNEDSDEDDFKMYVFILYRSRHFSIFYLQIFFLFVGLLLTVNVMLRKSCPISRVIMIVIVQPRKPKILLETYLLNGTMIYLISVTILMVRRS